MGSAAGVSLASSNIAHVLQPQRRYPEAIKIYQIDIRLGRRIGHRLTRRQR